MLEIRKAENKDISAMLDIYNHEVKGGTATLDLEPKSYESWCEWFRLHNTKSHPLLVAEINGEVVGYACLSPFRPKPAYNSTVELSVYVAHSRRGCGIGRALTERILSLARDNDGTHLVVSVITSENKVSISMHERLGFSFCGRISQAAFKFDRPIDVLFYELRV